MKTKITNIFIKAMTKLGQFLFTFGLLGSLMAIYILNTGGF